MAMSRLELPVFPWMKGYDSPQLDFIEGLTDWDEDFEDVWCRYYCDPFVHALRGLQPARLRDVLIGMFSRLPGRGDYLRVTPFALHFGWLHHKGPFYRFAERVWKQLTREDATVTEMMKSQGDGATFIADGAFEEAFEK